MQANLNNSRFAFLKSPASWMKGLKYFAVTFLCMAYLNTQVYFCVSETTSLAQHYFLHLPHVKPKLNDYTMVYSPWLNQKIIKKIIGVGGDFIWFNQNGDCYIDTQWVGPLHPIAFDQRTLNPIESQTIPKDYVFLHGSHPYSFDSRYEELGLVPTSSLQGRVIPLW
jgi:conjugal transfer pilin signal peptidase TrbI